ncbi:MAG TPA: hypothetical protein VF509_03055 [Sphingobium sp.]
MVDTLSRIRETDFAWDYPDEQDNFFASAAHVDKVIPSAPATADIPRLTPFHAVLLAPVAVWLGMSYVIKTWIATRTGDEDANWE